MTAVRLIVCKRCGCSNKIHPGEQLVVRDAYDTVGVKLAALPLRELHVPRYTAGNQMASRSDGLSLQGSHHTWRRHSRVIKREGLANPYGGGSGLRELPRKPIRRSSADGSRFQIVLGSPMSGVFRAVGHGGAF